MRSIALAVLFLAGCGPTGLCAYGAATATPTSFARGTAVTLTFTYPSSAFASTPMATGFASELLGPGGTLAGSLGPGASGQGAITSISVIDSTTVVVTLNIPMSSAAGTYTMSLNYAGSACPGSTPTNVTLTVS